MKHILLLFYVFFFFPLGSVQKSPFNAKKSVASKAGVDIIICTFDRPLQLDALLKSIKYYCTNIGTIFILMRSSSLEFKKAYLKIALENPELVWFLQDSPKNNFKYIVQRALELSTADYFMFAVDDLIVKDYCDLWYCAELIKKNKAYGFYLRLGTHLTHCHTMQCLQAIPVYTTIDNTIISWNFSESEYDWSSYAMLDMAIYPANIKYLFKKLKYSCPNSLEYAWKHAVTNAKNGICFTASKVVNIPINKVQQWGDTPTMGLYTTHELLDIFYNGLEIDFKKLYKINNSSGHIDWNPVFKMRTI